jgi:hypothetical protein
VYATRWIKEQPVGPRTLVLLHDHLRVATTYAEADPAGLAGAAGPRPRTEASSRSGRRHRPAGLGRRRRDRRQRALARASPSECPSSARPRWPPDPPGLRGGR